MLVFPFVANKPGTSGNKGINKETAKKKTTYFIEGGKTTYIGGRTIIFKLGSQIEIRPLSFVTLPKLKKIIFLVISS